MENTEGVRDNPAEQRFELEIDGEMAVASYEADAGTITFTHTFVPEPLRGRGLATKLIEAALDLVRAKGMKVVPLCPTVVAYIKSHAETQDLLTPDARAAIGV